jgi:hypothetical protein
MAQQAAATATPLPQLPITFDHKRHTTIRKQHLQINLLLLCATSGCQPGTAADVYQQQDEHALMTL